VFDKCEQPHAVVSFLGPLYIAIMHTTAMIYQNCRHSIQCTGVGEPV